MPSNLAPDLVNRAQLTQFNRISCLAKSQPRQSATNPAEPQRILAKIGLSKMKTSLVDRSARPSPIRITSQDICWQTYGSDQIKRSSTVSALEIFKWTEIISVASGEGWLLNWTVMNECFSSVNSTDLTSSPLSKHDVRRITLEFRSTSIQSVFCYAKITSFSVAVLTENV